MTKKPKENSDQEDKKTSKGKKAIHAYAKYSQIGLTIVMSLILGIVIGRFLDNALNTSPWLLLLFTFAGIGAAFRYLMDLFNQD